MSFNFIAFLGFHKAQACAYVLLTQQEPYVLTFTSDPRSRLILDMYLQRLDTKVPAGCTNMALKLLILHAYRTVL